MSKRNRPKRQKSFDTRFKELVEELEMLLSDMRNFEHSNRDLWIRSASGRLHKLLVERPKNRPLLIDLANIYQTPLTVYVSNFVMAQLKSRSEGGPAPIASLIPNILSPKYHSMNSYPMPIQKAIELPCLIIGGVDYTFKDILMAIRDTEGHHSDVDRPENLHILDGLEILGYSSAYMASYYLGQVVLVVGNNFLEAVSYKGVFPHLPTEYY